MRRPYSIDATALRRTKGVRGSAFRFEGLVLGLGSGLLVLAFVVLRFRVDVAHCDVSSILKLCAVSLDVTIRAAFLRSLSLHTEPAGTAPPDAFGPFRVLHQLGAGTLGPVFR